MTTVALTGQSLTTSQGRFTQVWTTLVGQHVTISQGQPRPGWVFRITLPTLSATGTMHVNPRANAAMQLPRLTLRAFGGVTARITLPAVRFAGGMTIPNIARVTATLPLLTLSATGKTGMTAQVAMVLPKLTVISYCGARAAIVLPKLISAAHGFVGEHASAVIQLPKLRGASAGHRLSDTASAIIVLPKLVMAQNVRNLPVYLPRLVVRAYATNNAVATAQCWAMNITNKAVTQFTNYPFRAFVRWRDRYYGVGFNGGLYLLEGDKDATVTPAAPIPWAWETGLDDLDSAAMKGISAIYVEGTIEPGATVLVVDDYRNRRTYSMHAKAGFNQATYRVITGKGIRTRNVGIGMASVVGGYMELTQISPELVVSKRNI